MAGRKNKHSADYFPHYIKHGNKMFYIEQKHGNDGYAIWFKIMERLAETDFHCCNLTEDAEMMFMASRCNVEENVLIDVLNILAKFEWIDSFLWSNYRVIYSQDFVESLAEMYKRRSVQLPTLMYTFIRLGVKNPYINTINVDINDINADINTQSKVKESKVKESKEKEDNTTTISLHKFYAKAIKDISWINRFVLHYNSSEKKIKIALGDFGNSQTEMKQDRDVKPYNEWCKHFSLWMKKVPKSKYHELIL